MSIIVDEVDAHPVLFYANNKHSNGAVYTIFVLHYIISFGLDSWHTVFHEN